MKMKSDGFKRTLVLLQPKTFVFGNGCASRLNDDLSGMDFRRVLMLTAPPLAEAIEPLSEALRKSGLSVLILDWIENEPTIKMFEEVLDAARDFRPDAVIGIGGGSVLDTAKLVAALMKSEMGIHEAFGIGKLPNRETHLACLPTTAGTGSEVSPNAVVLDETERTKKAVISPHLVPDAAYVDPLLTWSLPPVVTAFTGMDALAHCIKAVANRFAHPMIDLYALEGIRLINANLLAACQNGRDGRTRTRLALGSMYGGLCLGPVNTGAVHALAYPLAGEFRLPHGVSVAVLMPGVLEFDMPAAVDRYARVALAVGAGQAGSNEETARRGLEIIKKLIQDLGMAERLSMLGIPFEALDRMAASAMSVKRLLQNAMRNMTQSDAKEIYTRIF